jgi:hypothetical protein
VPAALQPCCCLISNGQQCICAQPVDISSFPPVLHSFQAASPDEEALVAGAAYLGTKLLSR